MTGLRQWFLDRVWYVQPAPVLIVQGSPNQCLRALAEAARPSKDRLHFRNLFLDGRRYYLDVVDGGFELRSDSAIPWRRKARSSVAAVLDAKFTSAGEDTTRIQLRARMRLLFWLDIFPVPAFMTSILVFAPWPNHTIVGLVTMLFLLSWMWHRLTAALQTADMIYFVDKALEDLSPAAPPLLAAASPHVVTTEPEFHQQWQKFYEEHKQG
ncbi:MAG: hypothetical protein R3E39_26180 [Anaerolineae bacterium]